MTPREWISPRELAGAPGMPALVRNVNILLNKRQYPRRRRVGSGGGWEYYLPSFPQTTQDHFAKATAHETLAESTSTATENQAVEMAKRNAIWERFDHAPQSVREVAIKRAGILVELREIMAHGLSQRAAIRALESRHDLDDRTILRWLERVRGADRSDWMALLTPGHSSGADTAEIPVEAWDIFKADYLRLERPAASACYERLTRVALANGWKIPHIKTFVRRLHRELTPQMIVLAREGSEALNRMYPAQKRSHSVFRALEAVNADGHTFDVFVKWPDGSIERPCMVAIQDILSAKFLGYRVDRSENKESVRLAFGDVVENYGIPSDVFLDNGRAFASKWLTGGTANRYRFKIKADEPTGILTSLGCKIHWCRPYHGQSKPIERAFRDLCETVAKHPAFKGCYTGNNPLAKPEDYGSRAVPLAEFLGVLDQEMLAHNARPGRRSDACDGRSFDELFNASYARGPVTKATPEQCRLWLLAAEQIHANREDGSVRLHDNTYWCEAMSFHRGKDLIVRFDPEKLHDHVHVYTNEGAYIGEAACVKAVGFADVDAAREHGRARAEYRKATRARMNAELRMSASDVAKRLPRIESPELPVAAVVHLTQPKMFAQPKDPTPTPHDPELVAAGAKIIEIDKERERDRQRIRDEDEVDYQRYAGLERQFEKDPKSLIATDLDWLVSARKDPMLSGRYDFERAFGAGGASGPAKVESR